MDQHRQAMNQVRSQKMLLPDNLLLNANTCDPMYTKHEKQRFDQGLMFQLFELHPEGHQHNDLAILLEHFWEFHYRPYWDRLLAFLLQSI